MHVLGYDISDMGKTAQFVPYCTVLFSYYLLQLPVLNYSVSILYLSKVELLVFLEDVLRVACLLRN